MKRIINNLDLAKAGSFLYKGWKNANFRAEIGGKMQEDYNFISNLSKPNKMSCITQYYIHV